MEIGLKSYLHKMLPDGDTMLTHSAMLGGRVETTHIYCCVMGATGNTFVKMVNDLKIVLQSEINIWKVYSQAQNEE